ncbi:DUF418 domain-containing protein [Shewanella khirikhana]|uniref:DUF418 domain-containing protein n=1 Tax=Shewanella khirikhana TaxID=1965282 RepID=A0ABM7CZ94_9GAMM|nr:DUF418 domain-containing protein [Shewanella khirikhana]AZQ09380.1 hypothetical protein STH12_00228 [Shewanella khirikhana]
MSEVRRTRNPSIDAVRGLAVLGIFFMNILFMGNSLFGYGATDPAAATDTAVELFSRVFLEGRFIGLFTLLFGVGLAIQFASFSRTTDNPFVPIKRRLKILMLFGLLHGVFIWPGDVLLTYGLSSLLAISYLNADMHTLRARSALFIGISLVSMAALSQIDIESINQIRTSEEFQEMLAPWVGSYPDQLLQHLMMMATMNMFILPLAMLWYVAGMMLLGMYLYRSEFFSYGFSSSHRSRVWALALLLVAIDLMLFLSDSPRLHSLSQASVIYSAIPVALLYADAIIRLCTSGPLRLSALQVVGKLALSLYILQSVVGILCFRYLFPEWLMDFDRIHYLAAAIVWALCQLLLASLYLKVFKQGPLETLWRYLAFGRQAGRSGTSEVSS